MIQNPVFAVVFSWIIDGKVNQHNIPFKFVYLTYYDYSHREKGNYKIL